LGATPRSVLGLVFSSTALDVIGGLACGVILSVSFGKFLSKWAQGSAQTPLIFAAATVLLLATSALAAFIPARRAASVDPMIALRYE